MEFLKYGKAICYSGYRQGQSPKTEVPTKEQIEEDLDILVKDGYQYIRMYDPNLHARRVLETIREKKLPIRCLVGVDSDPEENNLKCPFEKQDKSPEELLKNRERNDAEVEKLIAMAKEFDEEIVAVSIGNENTPEWGAHMVRPDRLLRHAKRLKEALAKPVTFCEGIFEWPHLKELGDYLDFISVHSYPLHYGETVDVAVEMNREHYQTVKELFPDKQVLFTEVGWTTRTTPITPEMKAAWEKENPDAVEMPGMKPEQVSVENQKRYITELSEWLEKEQIVGFIFEAFDEPWKGSQPESSECNWGLYYVDRTPKW